MSEYSYLRSESLAIIANLIALDHTNFLAQDSSKGPMAVSLLRADENNDTNKVLIRWTEGTDRREIQKDIPKRPWYRSALGLPPTSQSILEAAGDLPTEALTKINAPNLPEELVAMEERQVILPFGVTII